MRFRRPIFTLTKPRSYAILLLAAILLLYSFLLETLSYETTAPLAVGEMERHQAFIDSMIGAQKKRNNIIHPFNPNYLTDYHAYVLGIEKNTIDRLFAFRKSGKFINSAAEFKRITQMEDSLFESIKPFLKFPNFTKYKKEKVFKNLKKDINEVEEFDFLKVKGIGKVLSSRIVKYRKYIKGFSTLDQLYEVYGLDSLVVDNVKNHFEIQKLPELKKIKISEASLYDLSRIPYINKEESTEIIKLRTRQKKIILEDLFHITGFDSLKISRISLYLY
jgi:DNA uptake protein ComE-like DNA-binding protein